ncbi:Osmotin thaumatin-like protein [Clavulina sp. PMI_390]|nr:Osmotin thaumatin-like protein [Clavulina sp. PMI_390]
MVSAISAFLASFFLAAIDQPRTLTVYNGCPFTIWPAMLTDLTRNAATPSHPTGWEAAPYTYVTFEVPDNWAGGRIWGRRSCNFTNPNTGTCVSGGCDGGLVCDPYSAGAGAAPITIAELTLGSEKGFDYYHISLLSGYNLPMAITSSAGFPTVDCSVALSHICPASLAGPQDTTGFPIGCKSDCMVGTSLSDSASCCSRPQNLSTNCPLSGAPHYSFFKNHCPNAVVYGSDDSALKTVPSSAASDYIITFCGP